MAAKKKVEIKKAAKKTDALAAPANATPATIRYGGESKAVSNVENKTWGDLFMENAAALSFDASKPHTLRVDGFVVSPTDPAVAGKTAIASVSRETKGC